MLSSGKETFRTTSKTNFLPNVQKNGNARISAFVYLNFKKSLDKANVWITYSVEEPQSILETVDLIHGMNKCIVYSLWKVYKEVKEWIVEWINIIDSNVARKKRMNFGK